jgi:DNA-binding LytR/AlgR family response regulator
MTRAIIAEDEPLLAAALADSLAEVWPELEIVARAPNGIEALADIERLRPEVAFLDIRMPGLDGLELAAELADRLGEAAPLIVFVTAHDEYALEAFERAALDYLLKPVTVERLARTVARLRAQLAARRPGEDFAVLLSRLRRLFAEAPRDAAEPWRVLRAGAGNTVRMIPVEEVCYLQATDKYTNVVTREGEALIRTSIKELLARLPRERFAQIHRGTIVNLAEVAAALRDESGRVSLRLKHRKESLPVSRVYAHLFKQM